MGLNLVGGCTPKPLLLIILAIKLVCFILVLHYFSTLLISFYFLLTVHTFSRINILVLTIQEGHIFAHSHSPVCMCLIFLTIILLFFLPPSELSPFKSPLSFPLFHITLLYTKPIHITSIYITSIYITLIHIQS
ncbi:hypothetical protein BJV74DRAFT_874918, partial [Russula compacta]